MSRMCDGLDLGELERLGHERLPGPPHVSSLARISGDDLVDEVEGLEEAFDLMCSSARSPCRSRYW